MTESSLPKYYSFTSKNRTLEEAEQIYQSRISDARTVFSKFSDSFQERYCPFCGSDNFHQIDLFDNRYGVAKCGKCASLFVNPCPSSEALSYYYNNCECNFLLGQLLRRRHKQNNVTISSRCQKILSLLDEYATTRHKNTIEVLEVGCSSGVFLSELREAIDQRMPHLNVTLTGIDIDQKAIEKNVDSRNAISAISAEDYMIKSNKKFDMVLHFELIEHLADPYSFMKALNNLTTDSGINYFTTPNAEGFDNVAVSYNSKRLLAHGIFPPMHLNAFTTLNITLFALRANFNVVSVATPGVFDVDMVKLCLDCIQEDSTFSHISLFSDTQLAVVQSWLQNTKSSSHMEVTLKK